jgi:WD40 repeat protein
MAPPKLRPPSHIDSAPTPLFGLCWYGDPGDGTSIVAACGGGGSAATGVKNLLTVRFGLQDDVEPVIVKTGDQVGNSLYIAKSPITNKVSLFCALGSKVCVYSISSGQVNLEQQVGMGDTVNAVVANAMVDRIAVGCESGTVKVYQIKQDYQIEELASYVCEGHSEAVCSVAFAPRTNIMVSSAKDGTARVWKDDQCLTILTHTVHDANEAKPKREMQVLVRGCGFGDLDGRLIFSVASAKRGKAKAYLYKWGQDDTSQHYQCIERTAVSQRPVSSMSISGDAATIALGNTEGTVLLWNALKWKAIRSFPEVHDLPVTCIAARPYDVPLQGEEQSLVKYDAICASADSRMGWLTLQRRNPKRVAGKAGSGLFLANFVNTLVKVGLLYWILSPLARDMWETCGGVDLPGLRSKLQCIRDDIFIAPLSRPGIAIPPH